MNYLRINILLYLTIGIGNYVVTDDTDNEGYPDKFDPSEHDCPAISDRSLDTIHIPWGTTHRAYLTLPKEVELRKSRIPNSGYGVFAKTFIPQWTWLGEYEGEIVLKSGNATDYAFNIYRDRELTHFTDAYDIRTSNWVRFINCPQTPQGYNVDPTYCLGKVYLITKRDIYPNEELGLYYGDDYAERLGIDTALFY